MLGLTPDPPQRRRRHARGRRGSVHGHERVTAWQAGWHADGTSAGVRRGHRDRVGRDSSARNRHDMQGEVLPRPHLRTVSPDLADRLLPVEDA